MAVMSLGECGQCHGPLCVSGQQVCCERCGQPQPDHQLTKEIAAAPKKAPPAPVIPAQHYPASWGDRINTLEKIVAEQAARIVTLETEAAARRRK